MIVPLPATAHFVVSYDDTIAANPNHPSGADLAQTVLDFCEYDYARLAALFGVTLAPQNLPININIVASIPPNTSNTNNGNSAIPGGFAPTITVVVAVNNGFPLPAGMNGVVVAEEAEIFMVAQGSGWNPVYSDGEGLSRVSTQILYPENAWLAATGSSWFNPAVQPPHDYVDTVLHTDQDYPSMGCSALFLNYLAYQLNHTWPAIIGAAPTSTNTLAETAETLGVAGGGYAAFLSLLQTSFPSGNLYASSTAVEQQIDDVYPLGPPPAQLPALYIRHNTADDGTSHAPPLSVSPDIIMKNAQVPDPQATFSTVGSIASANESDPTVLGDQTNYLYLRVWNRGAAAAQNVFANVYWSPASTLVTPSLWTLIGTSYYPSVPTGSEVEVTTIGVPWPADQIPAAGHYCFVATVGNNYQPAPDPAFLASFATFQDYENYILANNNVTWRNFNVVEVPMGSIRPPFGHLVPLPFHLTGAWNGDEIFQFEIIAELPKGATLALQAADWIARGLTPAREGLTAHRDFQTDLANTRRLRIPLPSAGTHKLGEIKLPSRTAAPSHLLAHIPPELHDKPYDIAIRQLYEGREVGRITWRLTPVRKS